MENRRQIGKRKEEIAAVYLEEKGYQIIEKNFQCRMGEIDLIALQEKYLVFVEVKYRKNEKSGHPAEAVTWQKRKRIVNTAKYYLMKKKIGMDIPCRFDIVAITGECIEIIQNAFFMGE